VTLATPFVRLSQREHRRSRTRARLFQAALREFESAGFDGASVARIAREAGVSRPTFYFHFPTKEHVLLELQWKLELRIVERFAGRESLREVLYELVEGLIEAESSVGSPQLFRDVLRIYVRSPESLPLENLGDQPFPVYFELGRRFAGAAVRAELRAGLDPAQACRLCLTSVFGYLTATPGPSEERREDLQAVVSLYLNEPGEPSQSRGGPAAAGERGPER
jgi:AcrR family transcriptional regulator